MYGFTQKNTIKLRSSDMTVCEYIHESGAKLVLLDCDSEERAFGAVFKTVPFDFSGVFHVIEHSVVSGSERYPISSPILYMMKNSMKTYVNAITFQGKTAYLCSSCNEKDFENLLNVWLDAVFRPVLSEKTFMREGWHVERRGEDYSVQGVVYNEMSGATSAAESGIYLGVCGDLFPDTYQRFSSGGLPSQIPSLTYEKFLKTYKEFYSADNCVLFLSGKADRDYAMRVMDGYLKTARKAQVEHVYALQTPVVTQGRHVLSSLRQTDIVFSYVVCKYGDAENYYAAATLADYLFRDNSSCLKSALLGSCLMRDVKTFFISERQIAFGIICYGAEERDAEKIRSLIEENLQKFAESGFDKDSLKAVFAQFAFGIREGLALLPLQGVRNFPDFADNIFNGLPADTYFNNDAVIEKLRAETDGDYFEKLAKRLFLANAHRAVSVFVAVAENAENGAERKWEEKGSAPDAFSAYSESEKEELFQRYRAVRAEINAGDSPEDIAKMPVLKLSDVSAEIKFRPLEVSGNLMFTQAETGGIAYVRYYFSAKGFTDTELAAAKLLCGVLAQMPTRSRTAEQTAAEIRLNAGRVGWDIITPSAAQGEAEAYLRVTLAFEESKKERLIPLIGEILADSVYDCRLLAKAVGQEIIATQQSFASNAQVLAENGAAACFSESARLRSVTGGYYYYSFLKRAQDNAEGLSNLLKKTADKLFVLSRLKTGVTGRRAEGFIPALPEDYAEPEGFIESEEALRFLSGKDYESPVGCAYELPSGVSFNVKACALSPTVPYSGKHLVMAKLLSLGYLWRNIREKGGAYGAGLKFSREGILTFYSVCDPSVGKTYEVYDGVAQYLKTASFTAREIEGCIVGVAADFFRPLSAEDESKRNEFNFLCGVTADDIRKSLTQALDFKKEDVEGYIALFEDAAKRGNICSAGNGGAVRGSGLFGKIISL